MNTSIGVDFGGAGVKPGVVRGGVILEKGSVIPVAHVLGRRTGPPGSRF
jgi:hypothetical protein